MKLIENVIVSYFGNILYSYSRRCWHSITTNVFFMGVNNGRVWKTDDYGRTWKPIFDKESTGSIGDLAVSPSHPHVIYVGTGEGLHRPDLSIGDGVFKSTDGGIHGNI